MAHRGAIWTFITLLLFVSIGAQELTDTETVEPVVNASVPCPHQVIKGLGSCCSLPTFVPPEVMQSCFTSECSGFLNTFGTNGYSFTGWRSLFAQPGVLFPSNSIPESPMSMGGFPSESGMGFPGMGGGFPNMRGGRFPSRRLSPQEPPQDNDAEWVPTSALHGAKNNKGRRKVPSTYSRKKRHGMRGKGGGRGTFMCSMECIFRNLSLLTTEGGVNTEAVSTAFSKINNETWNPIVTEALSECTLQFGKANLSAIPTPSFGGKICNPGPALYMACIRRYLALKCPPTLTVENNEMCPLQMTTLKSCNPFAVAQCGRQGGFRRGGGDHWGRRGGDAWGRGGGGGGYDAEGGERPEKNRMNGRRHG